jgi:hypothetical protein
VSPFGHHTEPAPFVNARALVLTTTFVQSTQLEMNLSVEIPGGPPVLASPTWSVLSDCSGRTGVLRPGWWVPVLIDPASPDDARLDTDRVAADEDVALAINEALAGSTPADAVAVDEWRVTLALAVAEEIISAAGLTTETADAIRARLRLGV